MRCLAPAPSPFQHDLSSLVRFFAFCCTLRYITPFSLLYEDFELPVALPLSFYPLIVPPHSTFLEAPLSPLACPLCPYSPTITLRLRVGLAILAAPAPLFLSAPLSPPTARLRMPPPRAESSLCVAPAGKRRRTGLPHFALIPAYLLTYSLKYIMIVSSAIVVFFPRSRTYTPRRRISPSIEREREREGGGIPFRNPPSPFSFNRSCYLLLSKVEALPLPPSLSLPLSVSLSLCLAPPTGPAARRAHQRLAGLTGTG